VSRPEKGVGRDLVAMKPDFLPYPETQLMQKQPSLLKKLISIKLGTPNNKIVPVV
jgi:hypothetical protein